MAEGANDGAVHTQTVRCNDGGVHTRTVRWPPAAFNVGSSGLVYRLDPDAKRLRPSLLAYEPTWENASHNASKITVAFSTLAAPPADTGAAAAGPEPRLVAFSVRPAHARATETCRRRCREQKRDHRRRNRTGTLRP